MALLSIFVDIMARQRWGQRLRRPLIAVFRRILYAPMPREASGAVRLIRVSVTALRAEGIRTLEVLKPFKELAALFYNRVIAGCSRELTSRSFFHFVSFILQLLLTVHRLYTEPET